eukprot:SAG31_NODE_2900_length_4934_cov_2.001448_3_plen_153_part_00
MLTKVVDFPLAVWGFVALLSTSLFGVLRLPETAQLWCYVALSWALLTAAMILRRKLVRHSPEDAGATSNACVHRWQRGIVMQLTPGMQRPAKPTALAEQLGKVQQLGNGIGADIHDHYVVRCHRHSKANLCPVVPLRRSWFAAGFCRRSTRR